MNSSNSKMVDAQTNTELEDDDALSEISSEAKLNKREILSVEEVYWSALRQKVIVKINTKSKQQMKLKL